MATEEHPRLSQSPQSASRDGLERPVFRATGVALATVAAAYVTWLLADRLLLLFACTLVSLILLTITNVIRRRSGLPFAVSLALTVIGLLALIGGAVPAVVLAFEQGTSTGLWTIGVLLASGAGSSPRPATTPLGQ